MRRALYLEPGLALGHFALGSILQKAGDVPAARRSFRNVRDLCAARPALEPIRLGEGESAARLAAAAEAELVLLERPASRRGSTP
jgi:chemotaxis protein methyltransferase CheR